MALCIARAARSRLVPARAVLRGLSSSSSPAASSSRPRSRLGTAVAMSAVGVAPPPLPLNSPEAIAHTMQLEKDMMDLPLLHRLRQEDAADEWYETRPFTNVDPSLPQIQNHLLLGALRAPSRLAVPPLVRARKDETAAYAFVHIGRGLCGHDGIAHGGLLASLVDEASARTALLNLESHIGVTARLELDYKAPLRAGRFVVVRTTLLEKKGRKVVIEGSIEDVDGSTVYVRSRAIFVEPKYAKLLGSGEVLKALGVPPPQPAPGAGAVKS